jgi:hypothetical protein
LIVSANANARIIGGNDADIATLEIGPTQYIVFTLGAKLPFKHVAMLGYDSFSEVDKVLLTNPTGGL